MINLFSLFEDTKPTEISKSNLLKYGGMGLAGIGGLGYLWNEYKYGDLDKEDKQFNEHPVLKRKISSLWPWSNSDKYDSFLDKKKKYEDDKDSYKTLMKLGALSAGVGTVGDYLSNKNKTFLKDKK